VESAFNLLLLAGGIVVEGERFGSCCSLPRLMVIRAEANLVHLRESFKGRTFEFTETGLLGLTEKFDQLGGMVG
jgi:hypothetical protein